MINQHPFTVCGETLQTPMHVCAFFDSREQQYEIILPYLKEGLDNNEKIVNILQGSLHTGHCGCLSSHGIDVAKKVSKGQLEVLASEDTYLSGGNFAAQKMLALLESALTDAKNAGYDSIRACGEMVWALENIPGTDELIEYEARLNLLTPKYDCSLICMYDINLFSARTFADILATHPHVIINGKVHKNPYYVEPLDFLHTLLRRDKRSLGNA